MRERELREAADCLVCQKPIGASRLPMFWRVTIERHGVKLDVVTRQQGLTMLLGGSAELALVMGADEEMTIPLMKPVKFTVCDTCGNDTTTTQCVGELAERASLREEQRKKSEAGA